MKLIEIFIILCLMFNTAIAEQQIKTPEEAVAKALEYTNFNNIRDYLLENNVEATLLTDDTIESVYKKWISGNELWKIEFFNVSLNSIRGHVDDKDKYTANFEIVIDQKNGNLLHIAADIISLDKDNLRNKVYSHDDHYATANGLDNLVLPNIKPCPFLDVLTNSSYDFRQSSRIEAFFVTDSLAAERSEGPFWKVLLFNMPKIFTPPKRQSLIFVADTVIVNMHMTFDGKTCKYLGGGAKSK